MNFKDKLKELMDRIIGDTSGISWKDLDHKKVFAAVAVVAAVIILIIVGIVSAVSGDKKKQNSKDNTVISENAEGDLVSEEPVDEDPLEKDAYEEINDLIFKYFYSLSEGDIPMLQDVVDVLGEEEIETVEKKKDYIEAYHGLTCYTKKGLEENSYVVFVSYEMEIYNIDAYAPGIIPLYVYQNENGVYKIFNDEASEELKNHVLALAAEEEVAAVIADVEARYQQLVAEDEEHSKFLQTMLEAQQQEEEPEETEEPAEEEPEETGEPEETEEPEGEAVNKTMQFKETVRIRAERSTDSERIGTGYAMEPVTVLESYDDGWSRISYNGREGYCKTEFLQDPQ